MVVVRPFGPWSERGPHTERGPLIKWTVQRVHRRQASGRKAPGLFSLSPSRFLLTCFITSLPLSAPGVPNRAAQRQAPTRGESPGVRSHAGLQHGATRVGSLPVRCRWVKYPEGVETDTSMGKPGHAESLPKSRGYQPTSVRLRAGTLMVRRCRRSVPGEGGPGNRRQADLCVSRVTRGGLQAAPGGSGDNPP